MKHQGQMTSETLSMIMASNLFPELRSGQSQAIEVSTLGRGPGHTPPRDGIGGLPVAMGSTPSAMDIFEKDLGRRPANHVALSPVAFLARAAAIYPRRVAVIHGARQITYAEFHARCRRFAAALAFRGIGKGHTVAVLAPNIPALLEAHYAVPMAGAVLNAINTRLDAATIRLILQHGEARLLLVDREYASIAAEALVGLDAPPEVIDIDDPMAVGGRRIGRLEYEAFLAGGGAGITWTPPEDEWQALALNYTSGTTGDPKGVVYHHRGAYLGALGNALAFGLDERSVYLWTLPMFHCNGCPVNTYS